MNLVDQKIEDYCLQKSNLPSSDCDSIEQFTRANVHGAQMLIGKMEASFLGFLLKSIGAKRVLEFGTFTGYSALAMAEHLPADGEVITLDINEKTVALANSFWEKSKHGHKIKSLIGPALETTKNLNGHFDFVFIDADKKNYPAYLEIALGKLSPTGIIVVDNVLWSGRVVESAGDVHTDEHRNTQAIRDFNDLVFSRKDLHAVLLPIRDGMFLIRKA